MHNIVIFKLEVKNNSVLLQIIQNRYQAPLS